MCGIAGYIGTSPPNKHNIASTLKLMQNRGPDHQAYETMPMGQSQVVFLHSRLSILDLEARSNQPFTIGDTTLIFNGEIYNYIELRKELEERGIVLHTTSDTEVLLHYYILYGEHCVDHFEGMWAFAVYDRKKGIVFLSRDRFAEKPLYYVQSADGIYFGSEVKFLKSLSGTKYSTNEDHLIRYLICGYKSLYKGDETFFRGVKEIPYASNMIINDSLRPKISRYWTPKCEIQPMKLEDAIEGVRRHLFESVKIRLRSDVPLAFCLSGGVDSSALVSIAAKEFGCEVATFSITDDDERYNEYDNMMATIRDLDCKHYMIGIPKHEGLTRIKNLIDYHDAPVATTTYLIHSLLSEAISKEGYRVAFSGTAADELFTGYYDHFLLQLYELRNHPEHSRYQSEWEEHIRKHVRNPLLKNPSLYVENPSMREHVYDNFPELRGFANQTVMEEFTEHSFCDSLLRSRMMNEMFHEGVRPILHEDDLNSMFYSVENRSPYLDSRLFDFAYTIPPEHLIREGYGKYLLREAMSGILNDQVRLDRKKKGFNASVQSVIDLQSKEVRDYLLDDASPIFGLVKKAKVEPLLNMDSMPNHHSKFLFSFINAKIFMESQ